MELCWIMGKNAEPESIYHFVLLIHISWACCECCNESKMHSDINCSCLCK